MLLGVEQAKVLIFSYIGRAHRYMKEQYFLSFICLLGPILIP